MINMANRPDVAMRLAAVEFLFRHENPLKPSCCSADVFEPFIRRSLRVICDAGGYFSIAIVASPSSPGPEWRADPRSARVETAGRRAKTARLLQSERRSYLMKE